MKKVHFKCTEPGSNSLASTKERNVAPPFRVVINDKEDLSEIIQGKKGACVYQIDVLPQKGVWDYNVRTDGQGPKGLGSGALELHFEDQSGATYRKALRSSTRKTHNMEYNSDNPMIVKITWGNIS